MVFSRKLGNWRSKSTTSSWIQSYCLESWPVVCLGFNFRAALYIYFLRWAKSGLFFIYFCLFVEIIILVVSRIQTRIVGVEGKDADHQTTIMAFIYLLQRYNCWVVRCYVFLIMFFLLQYSTKSLWCHGWFKHYDLLIRGIQAWDSNPVRHNWNIIYFHGSNQLRICRFMQWLLFS